MKIKTEGHSYELQSVKHDSFQTLNFMKKVQKKPDSTEIETVMIGTTNEEVLKVLIDRLQFLQNSIPCRENSIVITKLEESLMWLEKRTANRISRNVEGTCKK